MNITCDCLHSTKSMSDNELTMTMKCKLCGSGIIFNLQSLETVPKLKRLNQKNLFKHLQLGKHSLN